MKGADQKPLFLCRQTVVFWFSNFRLAVRVGKVMINPKKYLDGHLEGHTNQYKMLVARVYLGVIRTIVTKAKKPLVQGFYHYAKGNKKEQYSSFLAGSKVWATDVLRITKGNLYVINEIEPPASGHLIFLNHVNELDFPFDCFVINKPYLANQQIKSTVFAYWWMKAMGSQVFDNRKSATVAVSVRNLLRALHLNSFIVYPEGHNSYKEEIQPLKKGMIKIAFENNIPIYLVLKSGIASFQERQRGNVIGYKAVGYFHPEKYDSWEKLRDAIHESMLRNKRELDDELSQKEPSLVG